MAGVYLPRRRYMKKIVFFLFCFICSSFSRAEITKPSSTSEDRLVQRVKGVFSLKEEKSLTLPPICATPIFLELPFVWDNLSQEAKELLSLYSYRPSFPVESLYDTPGGHFKIHYTVYGDSAVFEPSVDVNPADGVPDYVNRCGEIMDSVWTRQVDSLNYNPPPSDGSGGGDDKYDVYLIKLSMGYLGYASMEGFVSYPSAYSYIVIRNDYSGYGYTDQYDLMRVTVAHEFFHAIQFGYDATEFEYANSEAKPYWMEMSAVWMEDVCYDHINDYLGYLPWFYNYPWLSLKTFSHYWTAPESLYHPYASCVFPIFLSEKFGTDIIREIWEECSWDAGPSFDFSTDDILYVNYGGRSLIEEFRQFTIWNYFTQARSDTVNFFSEGNLFPWVAISETHGSYPVNVSSVDNPPSNLACNYIRFITGISPGGLRINFNGQDECAWKISLIGYRPGFPPLLEQFDLDSLNQGSLAIYNWQDFQEIVMIPAVVNWDSALCSYSYGAEFDGSLVDVEKEEIDLVPGSFYLLQNYPNPFNATTLIRFTVSGSSLPTTLQIFNIRGEQVRALVDQNVAGGSYDVVWDGKDDQGKNVSSGIYFYQLKVGDCTDTKKLVLIK